MPGDLLDLILLVLMAAFAVAGYRQGFIVGMLSLIGFVTGVAVGAYIAPGVSRALAKSASWQAIVAILVVFGVAVLGMLLASGIGVAVRSRVTGRPATVADSLGGAAVNVVAVLVVAWLLGTFMNTGRFPAITRQVDHSAVLRTVDAVMPPSALYLPWFPGLRSLLANGLYTPVYDAIGVRAISLPAPDSSVVRSAAIARDRRSIVKIRGIARSCSQAIEGTGFVISPQHVLTNAHVVAGVEGPNVFSHHQRLAATVVLYDPGRDLAVLYVPGLSAPPLSFAYAASNDARAVVAGYPDNGVLTMDAATVGRSTTAYGPNIYLKGSIHRQVYPVRALIRPGNSGGPLLAVDGKVYGVVFAKATAQFDAGYALTAGEVATDVAKGHDLVARVTTQACQRGG